MRTFGTDVVERFLKRNDLCMIIRSNQNCQDGIDHFAANQVVTISSCTNYAGTQQNDACLLVIQKKLRLAPKIIKPLEQEANSWQKIDGISETADSCVQHIPPKM